MNLLFILAIFLILALGYFLYQCQFGATPGQRVMQVPTLTPFDLTMQFTADQIMDPNMLFLMKSGFSGEFPTMFTTDELAVVKQNALAFFKESFGLSDAYLNLTATELRVNPDSNYQSSGMPIMDGGFVVPIPKGMPLHGKYGGESGVASSKQTILAYGHYVLPNGYTIIYKSTCPMITFSTFDGNYTPIDCYTEILESPNPSDVGMQGKAIGLYRSTLLANGQSLVVIRNVLTFPQEM